MVFNATFNTFDSINETYLDYINSTSHVIYKQNILFLTSSNQST
jgi:hypothetical protein